MNLPVLLTGAALLGAVASAQAQANTPAIQTIRDNYAAVNAQIAAGKYRRTVDQGDTCGGYETRTRWKDARGQLRRYRIVSDADTYSTGVRFVTDFWFDAGGRRDFVLATRSSTPVSPDDYELRVYYNDAEAVIRTISRPQLPQAEIRALLTIIDGEWDARVYPIPEYCGD